MNAALICSLIAIASSWSNPSLAQSEPQREVAENIRAVQAGTWTVADLAWPQSYMERLSGRVFRASYEENFRQVVRDPEAPAPEPERVAQPRAEKPAPEGAIVVMRNDPDDARRALRDALPDGLPSARGFRAPVVGVEPGAWPFEQPENERERAASGAAMGRLATDGLLVATAHAMEALASPGESLDNERLEATLRRLGLPTDMYGHFTLSGAGVEGAGIPSWIAQRIAEGRKASELMEELKAAEFAWTPTIPGFEVMSESGEEAFGAMRLQLTRGDDWLAPGDGGSIDLLRQLVAELPEVDFTVSIEPEFVDTFVDVANQWPLERERRIVAVVEELSKISQWAHDNTKAGTVIRMTGDGPREVGPASLAPRYASLGEIGTRFVQGDSFLLDGLKLAGRRVEPSGLLFQGGDLLTVTEPKSGERIMLIGEATILRNVALGLSREQAIEAFRVEFGVDRCEVLPAVSFHIDYEVTVRAVDGKLLAFMNHSEAACRIIIEEGLRVLARAQVFDPTQLDPAIALAREGKWFDLLGLMGGVRTFTQFPDHFANQFSAGQGDLGAGNLQRFLLALDLAAAHSPVHPNTEPTAEETAYLASLVRRDEERIALAQALERLGMTVVAVPSLSDGERSVNYINGLHDRTRYLMPAWGGLYAPLDEAGAEAFRAALGPDVRVIPILTSESQRRNGAVRCSIETHPKR